MSIQSVFDKYASSYDAARIKLIPCFHDFYQIAIDTIPFAEEKKLDVLDLGAGTGLMAGMVAQRYPKARIVLMDIAEKMLSEARTRLEIHPNKFDFIATNYSEPDAFTQNFDLVISSLSIHHLTDKEKQNLFKTIFQHLKEGGIFINADQVLGETRKLETKYREQWVQQVKDNGTTNEELEAALERMQEDKMSTLSSQLQWLKEAGFCDVNCWYKNYSFTVVSGSK